MIALRRLPAPIFMSHFWVLPIVASVLGVLVLGEHLSSYGYVAGGLIITALIALVAANIREKRRTAQAEKSVISAGEPGAVLGTCTVRQVADGDNRAISRWPAFLDALRRTFGAWIG
jgi:hypothetical protein